MSPSSAFDTYTNVAAWAAPARAMSAINMVPLARIAEVFICPLLSTKRVGRKGSNCESGLPLSFWDGEYSVCARVAQSPIGCVRGALAPMLCSANRRRRSPIHRAKGGVESPDARESRGERDIGHRHHGLVDEPFRALHPPGHSDRGGRSTRVPPEQSAQMAARHAELLGEMLDGLAIVEEAALDETQGARNARRRTVPGRCPRGRLGATS